ncbi:MAG: hypothetical protein AAGJ35_13615, partial [Myxococcota bacterium]
MTVQQLKLAASEFPPEPLPPPPNKAFNKLLGNDRRRKLEDPDYEAELIEECLTARLQGTRCEVCDTADEDGRFITKCRDCGIAFCDACTAPCDGIHGGNRNYQCLPCNLKENESKSIPPGAPPQCQLCPHPGGWLRQAKAKPINKKSYWKARPKDYQKSLFAKPFWVHQGCQMWHDKLTLNPKTGVVDCNQVVMTHGMGFIREKRICALCGNTKGMKLSCDVDSCKGWGSRGKWDFHVACARQAGLEVLSEQEDNGYYRFFLKCYQHGG